MNKTELVAAIAKKTELSKKDAEKALKAFTDVVAEEKSSDSNVCVEQNVTSKSNRQKVKGEKIA